MDTLSVHTMVLGAGIAIIHCTIRGEHTIPIINITVVAGAGIVVVADFLRMNTLCTELST